MPSEARRSNARQLLARIRPHKNAAVLFVIPNGLSGESLPCFCRSPEPSEGEVEGDLLSRVFRSLFQPCRPNFADPISTIFPPAVRLHKWMNELSGIISMTEQDRRISEIVAEQRSRLRNFIRRRVPDRSDAEDIVQEVFYELVEANRLLMPIEHVTGWLFRVARNRIIDLFRKKRPENFSDVAVAHEDEEGELLRLEDLLPSVDASPEALYARSVLLDELELAVEELPEEQRQVFIAHELEGHSFKQMAAETGVNLNTLLSRKRYAVRHLRQRLQDIYDEFTKA